MTEQKQPEALRLAVCLEWNFEFMLCTSQSSIELRRQHAEIEALRAKLDALEKQEHAAFVNEQGFIVERDDMQISSGEKLYLAAGARPQEASYTSVQLAEMILSDCGCSTNNASLLERVAKRIDRHSDTLSQPAPAAQVDVKDAAQLYPVVIDGLLWLCAKHGGTFKPVADCAAVNPPLSWKNALAADKKEPTNGND